MEHISWLLILVIFIFSVIFIVGILKKTLEAGFFISVFVILLVVAGHGWYDIFLDFFA